MIEPIMTIKVNAEKVPMCYKDTVEKYEKEQQDIVNQEFKNLGEPRVCTDLLRDLQMLAIQKQTLVKKWGKNNA